MVVSNALATEAAEASDDLMPTGASSSRDGLPESEIENIRRPQLKSLREVDHCVRNHHNAWMHGPSLGMAIE